MKQAGWRLWVKRGIDRSVAAVGLVAVAPVMAAVAVAVRASMGSPVLFTQERPGLGGRVFRGDEVSYDARRQRPRRSPAARRRAAHLRGAVSARHQSLDELPQLWNVLRGELSLVGPRPLLVRYLPRYSPTQARRHEVMPGITGWAQVNGRNALSWDEKFALDVWYVEHWSLGLDAKILAMTAWKVLRRDGIANAEAATMPEFMGPAAPEGAVG
jgi:lipopolysaccharide/colanic/teichoic acid biosynthesis glycosyltransferase